jgi:hypothetical protein
LPDPGQCIERDYSPAAPPPERHTYGAPHTLADATPEAGWIRKNDSGDDFPHEEDGKQAWSAVFICYAMRISGAAAAFPYRPDHAVYFNAAKRTSGADHGWLMTAERPQTKGLYLRHRSGGVSAMTAMGQEDQSPPPALSACYRWAGLAIVTVRGRRPFRGCERPISPGGVEITGQGGKRPAITAVGRCAFPAALWLLAQPFAKPPKPSLTRCVSLDQFCSSECLYRQAAKWLVGW